MKKIIPLLIALVLAAAMLAGCTTGPGTDNATNAPATEAATAAPTDAPKATDAPAPTENITAAPTEEPEPTAEPYSDKYFVTEIIDWDDADTKAFSFDTIKLNGKIMADGTVGAYRAEIEDIIDGTDGKITTVTMRGWAGLLEEPMTSIGYQIDGGPLVMSPAFFETTQPEVKAAGGEFATRFSVDIPVGHLAGTGHVLNLVCQTETLTVYMNSESNPFVLIYDGPEAGEAKVDGVINVGEYTDHYILDKTNAKSWTNTKMGKAAIDYYLGIRDGALYVGIIGTNVAAGDMIQLNFNPAAKLEDTTGLFLSIVPGETLKVLQHNHKTALLDDDNAGGADITSLIESKMETTEKGFVIELKLPAEFFKVTDVEGAADFVLSDMRLYFGMFAVVGGGGYTNQSSAPGSSWTCVDLGIHEYYIA